MIEQICSCISAQGESFNIKNLSTMYGFTERYIQKLLLNNVGLPPRSIYNVQRFNKSLELVRRIDLPLTAIAYDCGYYDQAHFIKEFKKYTGLTPSEVRSII
jgi:AraC-like DNA-binding protein